MRISELAGATGASVATLKYYLREGCSTPVG
ncbi:MerR family transcriptional regulator [Marihabitans asiaticum]|nr:MerR family transcriptional regulator [Marihabitans asiaticum]